MTKCECYCCEGERRDVADAEFDLFETTRKPLRYTKEDIADLEQALEESKQRYAQQLEKNHKGAEK